MKMIRHDKKFILLNVNNGLFKREPQKVMSIMSLHGAIRMTLVTMELIKHRKTKYYPITLYTTEKRYNNIAYRLAKLELDLDCQIA